MCLAEQSARDAALAELARLDPAALDAACRSQGGATSLDDLALFCHLHHHYFIHLLGWTITGHPNGTLHFTHPGGWLTLDSPLPGTDRTQLPDAA